MQGRKSQEPGSKTGRKASPKATTKATAKTGTKTRAKGKAKDGDSDAGVAPDADAALEAPIDSAAETAGDAGAEPASASSSGSDLDAEADAAAEPHVPESGETDAGAAVFGSGASATQESNRMVWRGQSGHYEVWFLTVHDPATRTSYWLRYTLESPDPAHGSPYVELWFCRSDAANPQRNFGIHRRFPLSSFESSQSPFLLRIGESELGHAHASGSLAGNGHEVSWELRWEPAERLHLLLPSSLYADRLGIAESLVLSPNHSIEVRGSLQIDGERLELSGARAGQSHIWGRKHAYGWGWGRCNSFERVDEQPLATPASAVLETLSVRMRRGPVVVPLTVVSVYPDGLVGQELAFKQWLTMPLCRADFRTGSYSVTAQGPTSKIEVQYACRPDDMIRTEYVDPDGSPAYCHFAGAASCRLTLSRRTLPGARWKVFRTFRTEHGAQFEWAGRAGDSQVKNRHVRIEG